MDVTHLRKPRCYMLYALAGENTTPSQANQTLNNICADQALPLTIYHDHFIGQAGGIIIFYAETAPEREALQHNLAPYLEGWHYTLHPLIYSYDPAAFDAQTAYTLKAYRNTDWEQLQNDKRPAYGDLREEAETAQEG